MSGFSKSSEERLLGYVRTVQGHVSDGMRPNAAVVKVARDNNIPNDLLPMIVQAHNVGTQGYQRERTRGGSTLDKVASFPLARIEEIRAELYPAKPQTSAAIKRASSVSADYSRPPVIHYETAREKQASAVLAPAEPVDAGYQGDPKYKVRKMAAAKQKVAYDLDQAKTDEIRAHDQFLGSLARVAGYFKSASYSRLPLAEVDYNAQQLWGPLAKDVMDFATARSRTKEARATGPPKQLRAVDVTAVPYCHIKEAIDAAQVYAEKRRAFTVLDKEAESKIAEIERPFCERHPGAPPPTSVLDTDVSTQQKAASFFAPVMTGLSAGVASGARKSFPSADQMIGKMEEKLDDPAHEDELRGIEAKAMLNDLIANDEVISGYDPQEVSTAYNELTQLSPSAATQPALMRPLLRKRLTAGSVEAFEGEQMASIEKTLRQTENMHQDPKSNASPALV